MLTYPCRCKIVDATGIEVMPGFMGRTPNISQPHIYQFGVAEKTDGFNVKITLDDGTILMGYECWWTPVDMQDAPPLPNTSPFYVQG
jgi:hypothetical protein